MNDNKILTDEITKYASPTARILIALATVGVATTGQLIRLAAGLSTTEELELKKEKGFAKSCRIITNEAEKLKDTEGYIKVKRSFQLPRHMNNTVVDVWYLSEKGLLAAKVIDDYFTRFSKAGLPGGSGGNRIPHELAVTESFLSLCQKHTVCDYFPEWELRRKIISTRGRVSKFTKNPSDISEATGDFKVILLPKENRNAKKMIVEGEAAINYRRSQIKAKPNNMLWFVTSQVQKDVVNACKEGRIKAIWTLGAVSNPIENANEERGTVKEKTEKRKGILDKKITRHLLDTGSAFTGKALAVLLNENVGNISRSLGKLQKSEEIKNTEVKLTPSKGRGRPNKLFWHTNHDDEHGSEYEERAKKLVLSETIIYFGSRQYVLRNLSKNPLTAEFIPLNDKKKSSVTVVYDDERISINDVREALESVKKENENDGKESAGYTILAVATERRMKELRNRNVQAITFVAESKSVDKEIGNNRSG